MRNLLITVVQHDTEPIFYTFTECGEQVVMPLPCPCTLGV